MTKDEIEKLFRDNMRSFREAAGLSQSDVARRMGAKPGFVCDFERGRRSPTLGTLAAIAEALEVSPSYLISTAPVRKKRKTA